MTRDWRPRPTSIWERWPQKKHASWRANILKPSPPEKRQEIVDQLKAAVASFRHCLDLQPENARARRDIELVRQWIKYYSDQWQAHDREKRRQETNLVAFLEFLIETQRALRESVKALTVDIAGRRLCRAEAGCRMSFKKRSPRSRRRSRPSSAPATGPVARSAG